MTVAKATKTLKVIIINMGVPHAHTRTNFAMRAATWRIW